MGSEASLKSAVLAARTIGTSTGPSGAHLMALFERWGVAGEVARRTVQAPPGVPMASLVAKGAVELGFQQLAELMHVPGVEVAGLLPPGAAFVTTFSAALGKDTAQAAAARAALEFINSPEGATLKRRHGMEPA